MKAVFCLYFTLCNAPLCRCRVRNPIKGPRCFLEQETSPLLLSTGCSRNGFERDFTIEL